MSASLPVDLRSDTVTRPTPAMRDAMFHAEVGDDMFGEDPTVNALEAESARLFGLEAGLFVASGTLANQLAIRVHTQAGDEVLVGRWAHSYLFETGAAAALGGVQITPVGKTGLFSVDELREELKPSSLHTPTSRLVMLENTHNKGGGRVFPIEQISAIHGFARAHGLAIHLDGARIFNACAATGLEPGAFGPLVDTLSFCLSKGLGAPVGSLLIGPRALIERARRFRKMYGGAMRQIGFLAAAGRYALEHHRSRLIQDHEQALRLAARLERLDGVRIPVLPETNILIFELDPAQTTPELLCERAASAGVLLMPFGRTSVRAVFHLDVSLDQGEYAGAVLEELLRRT